MGKPVGRRDQEVARLIDGLDPEVVEAAGEVDRTLIECALDLSPLERVERAGRIAAALRRYRRADG